MLKVVPSAKYWFTFSGLVMLACLVAIGLSFARFGSPVKLGLDFLGGTKIEYRFAPQAKLSVATVQEQVLGLIAPDLAKDTVVQLAEGNLLVLRLRELTLDEKEKLDLKLREAFGEFEILAVDSISPVIGGELLWSGLIALFVCLGGILLYVSFRFRQDFALCAVVALLHDVLLVLGLFATLGLTMGIEVNLLFLTACLTVLGFSIHDTIVVFDRVRENLKFISKKKTFAEVIDDSVDQVWFRSLCTSATCLVTLGCLFVFGGESTQLFAGAMFVGLLSGSYSSIFVASPLLAKLSGLKLQPVGT